MTSAPERSPPRRPPVGPCGTRRIITSLTNERVKLIRSLEMRKARRETGLFLAEGASVLLMARDHGWRPHMLVLGPSDRRLPVHESLLTWALNAGAECLEVSDAVLAKLAAKDNPQSVMAVFEQRWSPPPDLSRLDNRTLWLALEAVRDPGNLGTILRTLDAVGADGVILVGLCCDPYSREAVRATMGSIFASRLVRLEEAEFHALAERWPGARIATSLTGEQDFRRLEYVGPTLLMMGSEGPGLTERTLATATSRVRIPMAGRLDSLNLAVATALMLYEIRRKVL